MGVYKAIICLKPTRIPNKYSTPLKHKHLSCWFAHMYNIVACIYIHIYNILTVNMCKNDFFVGGHAVMMKKTSAPQTNRPQDQLRNGVFFYLYTKSTGNDQFQLNLRKFYRKMLFFSCSFFLPSVYIQSIFSFTIYQTVWVEPPLAAAVPCTGPVCSQGNIVKWRDLLVRDLWNDWENFRYTKTLYKKTNEISLFELALAHCVLSTAAAAPSRAIKLWWVNIRNLTLLYFIMMWKKKHNATIVYS